MADEVNIPSRMLEAFGLIVSSGGVVALFNAFANRRRVRAEALRIDRETEGAHETGTIERLERENARLDQKLKHLEAHASQVAQRLAAAEQELRSVQWQRQQLAAQIETMTTQLRHAQQMVAQYRGDAERYFREIEIMHGERQRTSDIPAPSRKQ